jgi:hypothetical protein
MKPQSPVEWLMTKLRESGWLKTPSSKAEEYLIEKTYLLARQKEQTQTEKDKCVMCNEETDHYVTDDISIRYGYVEGAGQLCRKCFNN